MWFEQNDFYISTKTFTNSNCPYIPYTILMSYDICKMSQNIYVRNTEKEKSYAFSNMDYS